MLELPPKRRAQDIAMTQSDSAASAEPNNICQGCRTVSYFML